MRFLLLLRRRASGALWLVLLSRSLALGQLVGAPALVPDQGTVYGSAGSRGPDPSKRYQRVVAVYPPGDIRGMSAGFSLQSLGFLLQTTTAATSGTLRVWLRNTADTNFLLASDWSYLLQSPVAFQAVYNGPLTIPATAGWYDVAFQTPFAYTGGGLYVAYEWETTAPAATSGTYGCVLSLSQGLRGATSATAFPAQLAQAADFRPVLRLGYPAPAQDAALVRVFGPGKTPQQACATPYPVQAVVRNAGTAALTNVPVTFAPGAGAGVAVTVTIASLAPGAETTVRLPGLAPAAAALNAYVKYTVALPTDQNPANDARTDSTLATLRELTYVTGFPNAALGAGYIGFNTAGAPSGTLLCRYPLRGPAAVSSVRLRLSTVAANVGNTVYAVLLDAQGQLLARSADVAITSAQNGGWLTCLLPAPTPVSGRAFFVGLAQTRPRTAGQYYYPLATQDEPVVRDSAYYSAVGDSALLGLKAPREFRSLGRFMVEASLESTPLATRGPAAPWALSAWPNPAHDRLRLALPAGTGPAEATWLDATGRTVRPPAALRPAPDGTADLNLAGLPPGLYVLRLRGAGWQRSPRVVVE